jgi:hypothetical protein
MYTLLTILFCCVFWLLGYIVYTGGWLFKKRATNEEEEPQNVRSPLVQMRTIGWQEILAHVRLNELLSVQGKTLSGEEIQIIISLGIGSKLQVIYLRVGSIVHRVPGGQSGIAEVKQGDALRLNYDNDDITLTPLLCPRDASSPETLISEHYFCLVLSLTNSLVDGVKISFAARCASIEGRFIKQWEIPTKQSDDSHRSKISSIADLAALAERVKNVQLANSFAERNVQPVPLDYGVCYLLGKSGGMRLRFLVDAEIAFLIVSDYNPDLNLAAFLKSLSISAQMHAKILMSNGVVSLAVQNKNGEYCVTSLAESNVLLSVEMIGDKPIPVVRVEMDESLGNVLDIYYQATSSFSNVMIWKSGGSIRKAERSH